MELKFFSSRELTHIINGALYLADTLQGISNQRRVSIPDCLKGFNSFELREIANLATERKNFLNECVPSIEIALLYGVKDAGYDTQSNGYIESYSGEAIIQLENGRTWRAVGNASSGDAWSAYNGYIEFFPLNF